MANRALFKSAAHKAPIADAVNSHNAPAYALAPKEALAQYVLTGCLNGTFYADAEDQLASILDLASKCGPEYVAKLAIYAREHGYMKDAPALLVAWLAAAEVTTKTNFLALAFPRVIDNAKMLANFVQIVRSGVTGRKSLGSRPKRLIENWFASRNDNQLFRASIGVAAPSLADVIRMVHPDPKRIYAGPLPETAAPVLSRRALYGYLSGRNKPQNAVDASKLPPLVQKYEAFKAWLASTAPDGPIGEKLRENGFKASTVDAVEMPDVPHQALTALALRPEHWKQIARNMQWTATRMNLNTMLRHDVFKDREMVQLIADRLRDRAQMEQARVFPYQILAAYTATKNAGAMPREIIDALHDAMEIATESVPQIDGRVVICVDVSGSMHSPVTGVRKGATSSVMCTEAAAVMAASILRRNRGAEVIVFSSQVHEKARFEPRDSVLTNAERMANEPAGGTNCSAPIAMLNAKGARPDLVIMLSDYESWCDSTGTQIRSTMGDPTAMMREWNSLRARHHSAKLVCIDLQPNDTVQAQTRPDVLNVGGFSDHVFAVVADFARGDFEGFSWTKRVEAVTFS